MSTVNTEGMSQRAVVRAMRVMKLLKGRNFHGVSLRALSKDLGENDSTVLNTLRAMEGEGMVVQYESTNHWAMSVACMQIHAANDAELVSWKTWRKSGKLAPRLNHVLIDGQRRRFDEPFQLNGGELKMMYPRDPKAPAKETINCGCVALYRPADDD